MGSQYLITLADIAQIPGLIKRGFLMGRAESRIALVGKSNVGKSSLINALLKQKIARVSATPGKTKAIHFFHSDELERIVVDLPGYGFAKRSKDEQAYWILLLDAYFKADTNLQVVFLLFDSRHGPSPHDLEALAYFAERQIPLQIVMTKFDQLKTQSERSKRKKEVLAALLDYEISADDLMWISVNDPKSIQDLRNRLK